MHVGLSKQEIRGRLLQAASNISAVSPTQEDMFDGREIPEQTQGSLPEYEEETYTGDNSSKAAFIIDNLLVNYFAVAREVAIRTYTSTWFIREQDIQFKTSLAKELAATFGIDGYRNTVWDSYAGIKGLGN